MITSVNSTIKRLSWTTSLVFLFCSTAWGADTRAPIILDPNNCSGTEICGNGIDEDCNGSDLACSGTDADMDGYPDSADCAPNDRTVYPGVYVSCQASCGRGTQLCQNNGTYSTCSCTPLCEATSGRNCYYISKQNGSDSNAGTFDKPWKTLRNITAFSSSVTKPTGWTQLQAGDVVYINSGVYDDIFTYSSGVLSTLRIESVTGAAATPLVVKAYPGTYPIIAPASQSEGIVVLNSSYVTVSGIEIFGASQAGVRVENSSNVKISDMRIRRTAISSTGQIAGVLAISSPNLEVSRNFIYDNYDSVNAKTSSSWNDSRDIILSQSSNASIHHNVIFQEPDKSASITGGCVEVIGSSSVATNIAIANNIMWNCYDASVRGTSSGITVTDNTILTSDPVSIVVPVVTVAAPGLQYSDGIEPGDPSVCEAPSGNKCYWVDADAPEGGNGTYASPYNSFETVAGYWDSNTFYQGLVKGGDYIYLKGRFRGSQHVAKTNSMRLTLERGAQGGTIDKPTVVKSYRGTTRAILDGEDVQSDLIIFRGTPSAPFTAGKIENIEIQNHSGRGISIDESVANVEVSNVYVHDGIGDPIVGTGGGILFKMTDIKHTFLIRNSYFKNNTKNFTGTSNNVGGISVLSDQNALSGSSITIRDNLVENEYHAIRHKHSGNVQTITYNNRINNCKSAVYIRARFNKIHHNIISNMSEAAFVIVGENQTGDASHEIYNNTISGARYLITTQLEGTTYRNQVNLHDNLFQTTSAPEGVIWLGRWSGEVYNIADFVSSYNIFYSSTTPPAFMYHQNTAYSFSAAMTKIGDSTSRWKVITFANSDFALPSDSVAIGSGTSGGTIGAVAP